VLFRSKRKVIVSITHIDNSSEWFGKIVVIKGGVNYFLKDSSYNGLCLFNDTPYNLSKYDCIIKPQYHNIIDKYINKNNISSLYMGRFFDIETNDSKLLDQGNIICYVSSKKNKSRIKYLNTFDFNENNSHWKVVTPESAHSEYSGFGELFIASPNEVHTRSYIHFKVKNKEEAESLISYLKTGFANHMLSIRKISQHINKNSILWIPLVPLDRLWCDTSVSNYFSTI